MSTSMNQRARAFLPHLPLPRPRLTVVPKPAASARRLPFVVLVIAVLAAGLVGLLLLNTSMERGAYRVTAMRSEAATLTARQQTLQLQVAALQDPQEVAQRALRLGMVLDPSPAFISLGTGKVVGTSVAGVAGDQFDIGTKIGPRVDRLGKIAPVVGGAAAGSGTTVVQQPPAKQTGTTTNRADTGAGSRPSHG